VSGYTGEPASARTALAAVGSPTAQVAEFEAAKAIAMKTNTVVVLDVVGRNVGTRRVTTVCTADRHRSWGGA